MIMTNVLMLDEADEHSWQALKLVNKKWAHLLGNSKLYNLYVKSSPGFAHHMLMKDSRIGNRKILKLNKQYFESSKELIKPEEAVALIRNAHDLESLNEVARLPIFKNYYLSRDEVNAVLLKMHDNGMINKECFSEIATHGNLAKQIDRIFKDYNDELPERKSEKLPILSIQSLLVAKLAYIDDLWERDLLTPVYKFIRKQVLHCYTQGTRKRKSQMQKLLSSLSTLTLPKLSRSLTYQIFSGSLLFAGLTGNVGLLEYLRPCITTTANEPQHAPFLEHLTEIFDGVHDKAPITIIDAYGKLNQDRDYLLHIDVTELDIRFREYMSSPARNQKISASLESYMENYM